VVCEMHERDFVHGDLHSQNILVVGDTVFLLDFDWAGTYSSSRYPKEMNTSANCHPGVSSGGHYKEHDLCQIQQICLDH